MKTLLPLLFLTALTTAHPATSENHVDIEVDPSQVQFNIYYLPSLSYPPANNLFYTHLPPSTFLSVDNFTAPSHGFQRGRQGTLLTTDVATITSETWQQLLRPASVQEVCFDKFDAPEYAALLEETNGGERCITRAAATAGMVPPAATMRGRAPEAGEGECWRKYWDMAQVGTQHMAENALYGEFLRALDQVYGLNFFEGKERVVKNEIVTSDEEEDQKWGRFVYLDKAEGERVWEEGGSCGEYRRGVERLWEGNRGLGGGELSEEEKRFWGVYWGEVEV